MSLSLANVMMIMTVDKRPNTGATKEFSTALKRDKKLYQWQSKNIKRNSLKNGCQKANSSKTWADGASEKNILGVFFGESC